MLGEGHERKSKREEYHPNISRQKKEIFLAVNLH
jgi:hypothetical protein